MAGLPQFQGVESSNTKKFIMSSSVCVLCVVVAVSSSTTITLLYLDEKDLVD